MVTYRAADCQVHDAPYVPRYQATSGDRCPGRGRCSRPSSLLIATIGCYALRNLVVDVWVMFIAGIAGYFLRRSGYSMAGIVLGVILGHIGESTPVSTEPRCASELDRGSDVLPAKFGPAYAVGG